MAGHTKAGVIHAHLSHFTFECHPDLHQMAVLKKKKVTPSKNPAQIVKVTSLVCAVKLRMSTCWWRKQQHPSPTECMNASGDLFLEGLGRVSVQLQSKVH